MGMLKEARVWYQTQQTKSKGSRMISGSVLLGRTENGADDILVGKATVAGNILSQKAGWGLWLHHHPPLLALALAPLSPPLPAADMSRPTAEQQFLQRSAQGSISVITKVRILSRNTWKSPACSGKLDNVKHQRPVLAATFTRSQLTDHRLCPRHGGRCHLRLCPGRIITDAPTVRRTVRSRPAATPPPLRFR